MTPRATSMSPGDSTKPTITFPRYYAVDPVLASWLVEHPVSTRYLDGEPIRIGDWVDFGLDTGADNGVWAGLVVEVGPTGVWVDTHLNRVEAFRPDQLGLLERSA